MEEGKGCPFQHGPKNRRAYLHAFNFANTYSQACSNSIIIFLAHSSSSRKNAPRAGATRVSVLMGNLKLDSCARTDLGL